MEEWEELVFTTPTSMLHKESIWLNQFHANAMFFSTDNDRTETACFFALFPPSVFWYWRLVTRLVGGRGGGGGGGDEENKEEEEEEEEEEKEATPLVSGGLQGVCLLRTRWRQWVPVDGTPTVGGRLSPASVCLPGPSPPHPVHRSRHAALPMGSERRKGCRDFPLSLVPEQRSPWTHQA